MTSRNLFFKLQKEDFKRRTWSIALSMLLFFLLGPVLLALTMEGIESYRSTTDGIYKEIISIVGPGFATHYFLTITGALICAFSGFFFLHSRKKVDLYHSIPVKREVLFFVNYLNGILIYFIPYLFNLILSLLVLLAKGYLNVDTFSAGAQALMINLLYFLLIYTLVIIAVMLTGNGIVSILGTGVFLIYGTFLGAVKMMYFSDFFKTYVSTRNDENKILQFLSPVGKYLSRANKLQAGDYSGIFTSVLITMAVIVLLLIFALLLYKKRPSEAAGKAMAFEMAKPVIKFLMTVPVVLAGGLLFREAANLHSDGWLIFGLILTFIIFGAIVEIIYQFDLKKAFAHRVGLAISAVVTVLIVCIFRFDILSYDTYIPDKEKVATMSITIQGLDGDKQYTQINEDGTDYTYYSNFEYETKYMRIKDFDAAYEMAENGIQNVGKTISAGDDYYSIKVAYHLKNKRTVLRSYNVKKDEGKEALSQVYANSDFKEGYYPIYQWKSEFITSISATNYNTNKEFTLTKEEIKEFLETYKAELKALTIDEIQSSLPVTSIHFQMGNDRMFDYYVFPSFTKTIDLLAEHGFVADNQINVEDVKKITIYDYSYRFSDTVVAETAISYDKMAQDGYVYEGKEEISEILKTAMPADYCSSYSSLVNPINELEVNVVLGIDNYGNETSLTYYFPKDAIPEFVLEDTNYTQTQP